MMTAPNIQMWQQGVLVTPTRQWTLEVWDMCISDLCTLYRLRTRDGSDYFNWRSSEPNRIEQLASPDNRMHDDIKWFPFN